MAKTEKYFIGPQLLGEIRQAITRVNGQPDKTSGAHFRTAFQDLQRPSGSAFRICTFTGSWSKNATKNVVPRGDTSTTIPVVNLFANIAGSTSSYTQLNCAAAKDGTAWYLVAAECL